MALKPGTQLGPYHITAPLGAGGMGEVFRATDTKLKRDVAIKVLPDDVAGDSERLARFEREAQVLASLNHPSIATLHGLEEVEGKPFLVMELVGGETLAQRIAQGSIPLDDALPLFLQIADGLEAAHERGIIHRDLKPANVMVTPAGKVKILDFGLAKAFEAEGRPSAETSRSPTLTKDTAFGVILGTASYMSPEQARGLAMDQEDRRLGLRSLPLRGLGGESCVHGRVSPRNPGEGIGAHARLGTTAVDPAAFGSPSPVTIVGEGRP